MNNLLRRKRYHGALSEKDNHSDTVIESVYNKVGVPGVSHKSVRILALTAINCGISASLPISGCLMLLLLY